MDFRSIIELEVAEFVVQNCPIYKKKTLFASASMVIKNKARYTATEVACGWAGAIFEVTRSFGQEQ